MYKVEWELIPGDYHLERMKVPGGWLVKYTSDVMTQYHSDYSPEEGYEWRTSITFVPDPNCKWIVGDDDNEQA